jgi:nucleoside triphosphate diphosphatase
MDPDRLSSAIVDLVELVERLRGPGGCPWDAEQTDDTIKIYLLEEAYEVLEAIEKSSSTDVCLELGDLLFQVLFLARLAEERNEFDLVRVIEKIREKMVRRHPHVFGEVRVDTAEDVAVNWARIKKSEKGALHEASSLENVPVNLPALLRAHRLGERASREGFDPPHKGQIWDVVQERFEKLRSALAEKNKDLIGEVMGDILFHMAGLARAWGLNAEDVLRLANQRFLERFEEMKKEQLSCPGKRDHQPFGES